jgi:hypothetical protein
MTSNGLSEIVTGLKVDEKLIKKAITMDIIVPDHSIPNCGYPVSVDFPYEWYKLT